MRIWMVNHYAVPATDPGGTRHFSLARELVRQGNEVTIFASAFRHARAAEREDVSSRNERNVTITIIDGVRFVQVPTPAYIGNGFGRMRNMLAFAWRVWRLTREKRWAKPQVVLGSSPHPFAAIAARRIAKRFGVPFVLEVRDLWPDSLIKVAGVSPYHPIVLVLRLVERSLYRSASAIVTLLPNAAPYIIARGGRREGIVWIPNGVDFGIAGQAMAPRPTEGRNLRVTYAGTMGRANAMDSLLDTAAHVARELPAVRFRFIGDGPERPRLEERARREGVLNVTFDDPVSKTEVFDVLRDADILLVTTRKLDLYEHGLSFNKLFDYLAVGRPIVFGASCPMNPVLEADAGAVVTPEDSSAMARAIISLASKSEFERHEMGMRGRRYAEQHHDMRILAERMGDTFRRITR